MNLVPLQELLELSDSGVWGDEDVENGISVLRSTNFNNDGTIDFSKLTFRAIEERKREAKIIRDGDILLEKSGGGPKQPVGRVCLFRGHAITHSFGNFIARLRPKADILSEFLFYFLWHFHVQGKTSHYQKQTTGIRNLETKRFLSIAVPLPPLPEQRRIVDLLSRAEGIVRLRREAEKKAAELIPALFLDMFGDPATNPKGWDRVMVKDALTMPIRNGVSPSKSGTHRGSVLTLSAITRGGFDSRAVKESMFAAPLSAGDQVCAADFLVCRGNGNPDLVGSGCFPIADMPDVAFPDTAMAVRPAPSIFERAFFSSAWSTAHVRQQIKSLAKTTNGTYKINQPALGSIALPVPPLAQQRLFQERAEMIESIRLQQHSFRCGAEATFQALLARTFSPA